MDKPHEHRYYDEKEKCHKYNIRTCQPVPSKKCEKLTVKRPREVCVPEATSTKTKIEKPEHKAEESDKKHEPEHKDHYEHKHGDDHDREHEPEHKDYYEPKHGYHKRAIKVHHGYKKQEHKSTTPKPTTAKPKHHGYKKPVQKSYRPKHHKH